MPDLENVDAEFVMALEKEFEIELAAEEAKKASRSTQASNLANLTPISSIDLRAYKKW